MMTRISHRKGGEAEFKEITPKPQYVSLDSVVPPKVEGVPDMSDSSQIQQEIAHQRSVNGNGTQLNSDEWT